MIIVLIIIQAPLIDSSSTNGIIPDKMNPSIEFKDVCFSYPVNPQIQVNCKIIFIQFLPCSLDFERH